MNKSLFLAFLVVASLLLTLVSVTNTANGEEIENVPFSVTLSTCEYRVITISSGGDPIDKTIIHVEITYPIGTYEQDGEDWPYVCGIYWAYSQSGVSDFVNLTNDAIYDNGGCLDHGFATYTPQTATSTWPFDRTESGGGEYVAYHTRQFYLLLANPYTNKDVGVHETTITVGGYVKLYREKPIDFSFWIIVIIIVSVIGYAVYSFIKSPPIGGWRRIAAIYKHNQERLNRERNQYPPPPTTEYPPKPPGQ